MFWSKQGLRSLSKRLSKRPSEPITTKSWPDVLTVCSVSKALWGSSQLVPHWYGKLKRYYCSLDRKTFFSLTPLSSCSAVKMTYPESPRFVVFIKLFPSSFARTAVLLPVCLLRLTASINICLRVHSFSCCPISKMSRQSCLENRPESTPCLSQPPPPSATASN